MSEPEPELKAKSLVRYTRALLKIFLGTTIQGAVCITCGAALLGIGILMGRPWWNVPILLFVGMGMSIGPLRFYFGPERTVERLHARWDRWVKNGIISKAQFGRQKKELLDWYAQQAPRPPDKPSRERVDPFPFLDDDPEVD